VVFHFDGLILGWMTARSLFALDVFK